MEKDAVARFVPGREKSGRLENSPRGAGKRVRGDAPCPWSRKGEDEGDEEGAPRVISCRRLHVVLGTENRAKPLTLLKKKGTIVAFSENN